MSISELIEHLEEMRREYGDVQALVASEEQYGYVGADEPVTAVFHATYEGESAIVLRP